MLGWLAESIVRSCGLSITFTEPGSQRVASGVRITRSAECAPSGSARRFREREQLREQRGVRFEQVFADPVTDKTP